MTGIFNGADTLNIWTVTHPKPLGGFNLDFSYTFYSFLVYIMNVIYYSKFKDNMLKEK